MKNSLFFLEPLGFEPRSAESQSDILTIKTIVPTLFFIEGLKKINLQMTLLNTSSKKTNIWFYFPYHLVENSPWPFTTSFSIFSMLLGFVLSMQNPLHITGDYNKTMNCYILTILSLLSLTYSVYNWWNDIIKEGSKRGEHTLKVQNNLTLGFILFVISEVMIFVSLFFSYFYNSLIPDPKIFGGMWPPVGIESMDYKSVPLLNTAILFFSGISITATHNYLINKNKKSSIFYLFITIFLGLLFVYFQYFEYFNALFTISDSVFGSSFFLITGFHGIHGALSNLL